MSDPEKIYRGRRLEHGNVVTVNGQPLRPRSPDFDWARDNGASMHLAIAILTDCLGHEEAMRLRLRFKWRVIMKLPPGGWQISETDVRKAVLAIEQEDKKVIPS